MKRTLSFTRTAAVCGEIVAALAVATALVALLEKVAPIAGLGVLYLLAVFFVAVRHGEVPALATAVSSVLSSSTVWRITSSSAAAFAAASSTRT